ncbi:MAG: hypothetical protein WD511_00725 [Balneolaceae bacterium]
MNTDRLDILRQKLDRLRYFKENLTIENHHEFYAFIKEVEQLLEDNHRLSMNNLDYFEIKDPRDDELPF